MTEKTTLLGWIERDRDAIVGFLQDFVRAPSPNPPGDTRAAAAVVTAFLDRHGLPWREVAPVPEWPNLIGTLETGRPGPHLVLNGHMDVFPVDETETWTHGPWSGDLADGCVWGRGTVDMKAGTAASIMAYRYLSEMRDALCGRLTLTCVSDEETFGPYGARWLIEHEPEVFGDCVLNGEPSSPRTIRFGEKAPLWLRFSLRTQGAHGAYTHLSPSATLTMAHLIVDLEAAMGEVVDPPGRIAEALAAAGDEIDRAMGQGAADIVQRYTFSVGTITGGLKVNMIPGGCSFDADFRMPVGGSKHDLMACIRDVLQRYPAVEVEELNVTEPAACDPFHPMVGHLQANARLVSDLEPLPILSLGGTDARLWRQRGIAAYVYGPSPEGMGQKDERVAVDAYLHVVKVHVLAAFDYLRRP